MRTSLSVVCVCVLHAGVGIVPGRPGLWSTQRYLLSSQCRGLRKQQPRRRVRCAGTTLPCGCTARVQQARLGCACLCVNFVHHRQFQRHYRSACTEMLLHCRQQGARSRADTGTGVADWPELDRLACESSGRACEPHRKSIVLLIFVFPNRRLQPFGDNRRQRRSCGMAKSLSRMDLNLRARPRQK